MGIEVRLGEERPGGKGGIWGAVYRIDRTYRA